MTDPRERCRVAVARHRSALLALSHSLHAEPETAFDEHRSAAKVANLLESEGFTVERGVGGLATALTATFGDGELVAGVCAEYDALPGIGHACGHNVIAAAAVGAALALREVAAELGLTVRLIGTPAEESGGGKVLLLERGAFDGLAFALLIHPSPEEICAPRTLAVTDVEVTYRGRAAHASFAPQQGVNAADALTVAQVAIGLTRQHLEPYQLVHGITTHGGDAPNTVPDRTTAVYYLRARTAEALATLEQRVRDCLRAGALATGCTEEIRRAAPAYAELVSDPRLTAAYRTAITELGRVPMDVETEARHVTPASTDMGNVSRVLPAIQPSIAVDARGTVNHQPGFAQVCAGPSGDAAVLDGAVALAWTAVAAAADPAHRAALLDGARSRAAGAPGTALR